MSTAFPPVEIIITTRNRQSDLRRALLSCVSQDYPALEIRVYDDCSDDGTGAMVKHEFPSVVLLSAAKRRGRLRLRNTSLVESRADYIVGMDDDAWFTSVSTVTELVRHATATSRTAIFGIPFLEQRSGDRTMNSSAASPGSDLKSYVAAAYLCRVSALREVGGYHEFLVYQGEERDLCVRLRSAGWSVQMADTAPMVHAPSPIRDRTEMQRYGVRNQVLYDFFYAPWFLVPILTARHIWRLLRYRRDVGWMARTLLYSVEGIRDCRKYRRYRSPLALATFRAYMTLPVHGPSYVGASQLPPPCGVPDSSLACI